MRSLQGKSAFARGRTNAKVSTRQISSWSQAQAMLRHGASRRTTRRTALHPESSRSHSVLRLVISGAARAGKGNGAESQPSATTDSGCGVKSSRRGLNLPARPNCSKGQNKPQLVFVDLAGNESARVQEAAKRGLVLSPASMRERMNINASLPY